MFGVNDYVAVVTRYTSVCVCVYICVEATDDDRLNGTLSH